MVIPSSYLPPISWFTALMSGEPVFMEQYENYQKQTIRNRCVIDSPNGPLSLSVPVDRSYFSGGKCLMKDVRISGHSDWRRQHWHALETSYFNSPFFEYLQDDFIRVYEKDWTYLIDFNEALLDVCMDVMEIDKCIERTDSFVGCNSLSPFKNERPYYQVFQQKHGFLADLSIVDLIFNMGKESVLYLSCKNI